MSGCATGPIPARSGTIRPMCVTGSGPRARRRHRSGRPEVRILVVNAGSSSLKLSVLDGEQVRQAQELPAPGATFDPEQIARAVGELPEGGGDPSIDLHRLPE